MISSQKAHPAYEGRTLAIAKEHRVMPVDLLIPIVKDDPCVCARPTIAWGLADPSHAVPGG